MPRRSGKDRFARVRELYAFDEQIRLGGGVSPESATPPPEAVASGLVPNGRRPFSKASTVSGGVVVSGEGFTTPPRYAKNAEGFCNGKISLSDLRDLCGKEKRRFSLAGFDEAGRGALAGPVVVGCVRFPLASGFMPDDKETTRFFDVLTGLDDSKRVSAKKREALFFPITSISNWGIGYATPFEIDRIGIVPALTLAACRAYRAMRYPVDLLLLDRGLSLVGFTAQDAKATENRCKKEKFLCDLSVLCGKYPPELSFTKGDSRSLHIAAASILAKVHRDRTMVRLNAQYPGYGLDSNKGYGTPAHLAALGRLGPSSIHRRSFRAH